MSLLYNEAIIGAAGQGGAYEIEQSLRFNNADSAYMERTFSSAGNRQTWTYSCWFKHGKHSQQQTLWSAGTTFGVYDYINFSSNSGTYKDFLEHYIYAIGNYYRTSSVYRDDSAWYHVVIVWDTTNATAADRLRQYINGVRIDAYSVAPTITQNTNSSYINTAVKHRFGLRADSNTSYTGQLMDGYMAEVNFIDGTAVDPEGNLGEFDDNGVWRPIEYTGSYGSNGVYLKFDPTATNGIGHDHSGNGNNFTPTGFTTSGAGTDVMSDTPTNNFATLNAVDYSTQNVPTSFDEGNLQVTHRSSSGNYSLAASTIAFDSDDSDGFYFESIATDYVASSYQSVCLLDAEKTIQEFIGNAPVGGSTGSTFGIGFESSSGYLRNFGSTVSGWGPTTTTWTTDGDIIMVFVKNNKIYFGKNGTWLESADPSTESNPAITLSSTYKLKPGTAGRYSAKQSFNFGQRAFSYTPPTGAKTLCTANLPEPDIADGSDYFNTVLYTGNQTARDITVADNSGNAWQPDFVWLKSRAGTSGSANHVLFDAVRGANNGLYSSLNYAEAAFTQTLTSFNSDGFSLGTDADFGGSNWSSTTYVAWNWREGASQGFDIVSYTGNGVNGRGISHSLGVTPAFIIVKNRDSAESWAVWHKGLDSAIKYLVLDTTAAVGSASAIFGGGANEQLPDSTNFYIGSNGMVNANGDDYIAYCFADIEGYSKFGSYTGNGSNDGTFVYTGHKPRWIMYKRTDSASSWIMYDTARSTYNPAEGILSAEAADAEAFNTTFAFDILSNGFKFRGYNTGSINASGGTYVYMSFAENPFGGSGVSPATAR